MIYQTKDCSEASYNVCHEQPNGWYANYKSSCKYGYVLAAKGIPRGPGNIPRGKRYSPWPRKYSPRKKYSQRPRKYSPGQQILLPMYLPGFRRYDICIKYLQFLAKRLLWCVIICRKSSKTQFARKLVRWFLISHLLNRFDVSSQTTTVSIQCYVNNYKNKIKMALLTNLDFILRRAFMRYNIFQQPHASLGKHYHHTSSVKHSKSQNWKVSRFVLQKSLPNLLKPGRGWKCSCSSADRRYIWKIDNCIAY